MGYVGYNESRKQCNQRYKEKQDFFQVRLRSGLRDKIKAKADQEGKSLNELINDAIEQYVSKST